MTNLISIFVCLIVTTTAFQVPVFRYALERWRPDSYTLKVSFDTLAPQLESRLIDLSTAGQQKEASVNLLLDIQPAPQKGESAYLQLVLPNGTALSRQPLSEISLDSLLYSPKRTELIDHNRKIFVAPTLSTTPCFYKLATDLIDHGRPPFAINHDTIIADECHACAPGSTDRRTHGRTNTDDRVSADE